MKPEDLMRSMIARITADNDQDREMCKQWWRETSAADKIRVWNLIQQNHADPVMEIMSRFAQLAFGEMVAELGIGGA